jgi:hypothetical protein
VLESPAESVRHDLAAEGGEPIWGALTALAVVLFLGDVAARRVRVSLTTAKKVLAKTAVLRRRFGGTALPTGVGTRLLAAKRRAPTPSRTLVTALSERRREPEGSRAHSLPGRAPAASPGAVTRPHGHPPARRQPATPRPAATASRGEIGSRLLAAKQRAKG